MDISTLNRVSGYDFGSVVRKQPEVNQDTADRINLNTEASKPDVDTTVRTKSSPKPEVEFSFNLKPGAEYNLIGAGSKKEDIDVAKAVSDIKKDEILGQYKFFVGSTMINSEDGSVRRISR